MRRERGEAGVGLLDRHDAARAPPVVVERGSGSDDAACAGFFRLAERRAARSVARAPDGRGRAGAHVDAPFD